MQKIETEKFYLWKLDKEEEKNYKKIFNPIMEIDVEKEIFKEIRMYPINPFLIYKILAKQNKETKEISAVAIRQELSGEKEIICSGQFSEKEYQEMINGIDKDIKEKDGITPTIILGEEIEKTLKEIKTASKEIKTASGFGGKSLLS